MTSTEFKKGDRVTVTLEGTVTNIVPFGDNRIELRIEDADGSSRYVNPDVSKVEKVEPPVEVFGPGDVVRPKDISRYDAHARALGHEGYVVLGVGDHWKYGARGAFTREDFTSEKFERVEV